MNQIIKTKLVSMENNWEDNECGVYQNEKEKYDNNNNRKKLVKRMQNENRMLFVGGWEKKRTGKMKHLPFEINHAIEWDIRIG